MTIYKGNWKDDKMHEEGLYTWINWSRFYSGLKVKYTFEVRKSALKVIPTLEFA